MKFFSTVFFLCCFTIAAHSQHVNVSDFSVKPNTFTDVAEGVQKAIAACKSKPGSTLVFPQGRYDFWPEKAEKKEYFISNTSTETECPSKIKNIGLLFENMKELTVEGNGSLFVFHGKMITWAMDHCDNVQLQNISVDFERPSMSEITIKEIHPGYIIATIHPDSKYTIINGKLYLYGEGWGMNDNFSILVDTVNGTNYYSSVSAILNSSATVLANGALKFEGDFKNTNYKAGSILTVRDPIRDHVGAFVNLSKNIRLKNVNMHYMHGLGIVSQFSENLTYTNVNIVPSRNRAIASFADGMHFSGCKGKITIDSCHFKGLHDDPINVHGTYLRIEKVTSPKQLVVKFMHGQTYGFPAFFANDTIAFIHSQALQTTGLGIVKNAQLISEREIQIELSAPLPAGIKEGDCLENITWTASLEVRNSKFESTNTRGLLVTTPKKVIIENNHFYRTGMYPIQIACDAGSWYESGAVADVLIRSNVFEECGYNLGSNSYSIAVVPENHEWVKNYWVHRNIRIEDNKFIVLNNVVVRAKSVNGFSFINNNIQYSDFRKQDHDIQPAFKLDGCTKVVVKNNNYNLAAPQVIVDCNKMQKKDIAADKNVQLNINDK